MKVVGMQIILLFSCSAFIACKCESLQRCQPGDRGRTKLLRNVFERQGILPTRL